MARLLVSVRSAEEALAAVQGGAAIIDVKEPNRGSLGRAEFTVWREVRSAVPADLPVSVALGEFLEWGPFEAAPAELQGISWRKLGLAGMANANDWAARWTGLLQRWGSAPPWIAVAYADWRAAEAPHPDAILEAASRQSRCEGILVDTWDKSATSPIGLEWAAWFSKAREAGLITALAGRLDLEAIARLAPLAPDVIAVRSAACRDGDRSQAVDPSRVAALAEAAAAVGRGSPSEDRRSVGGAC